MEYINNQLLHITCCNTITMYTKGLGIGIMYTAL